MRLPVYGRPEAFLSPVGPGLGDADWRAQHVRGQWFPLRVSLRGLHPPILTVSLCRHVRVHPSVFPTALTQAPLNSDSTQISLPLVSASSTSPTHRN